MRALTAALACAATLTAIPAGAQTVYPIDRAEILIGARFDLKVEFDSQIDRTKVTVTINGRDHADHTRQGFTGLTGISAWRLSESTAGSQ